MGKAAFGIIGLVIGLAVGGYGGLSLGGGAMMGMGVATGLSAGICATVEAAQEEGIMTAGQVDQVLKRAAADLGGVTKLPQGEEMVGGAAECQAVLARLREAAAK
jgi:hypothetical protein